MLALRLSLGATMTMVEPGRADAHDAALALPCAWHMMLALHGPGQADAYDAGLAVVSSCDGGEAWPS